MVTSINHGICGVPTCWNCLKMIHLIVEDFWSSELPRLRESPLATQRMWFTSICSTPSPATSHLQRLQRLCWSRAEILVPSDQCPLHGTGKPKLVLFKRGNCLDLWPLSLHWRTQFCWQAIIYTWMWMGIFHRQENQSFPWNPNCCI